MVANNRGIIGKTIDGGLRWDIVTTQLRNIRSLFFIDSLNGSAVGADRLVARTDSGGRDWKIIEISILSDERL